MKILVEDTWAAPRRLGSCVSAFFGQDNVGYPGERVAVDVLRQLTEATAIDTWQSTGNRYLLCVMDYFTKWPEAYAIPNQEAQTVANAIVDGYVSRFGVTHEPHSGRSFESAVFKGMCYRLGIKKTRTTPLHPQSDGIVERFNRTIGNQFAMYAQDNPSEWDRHVPLLLLAYRSAVHVYRSAVASDCSIQVTLCCSTIHSERRECVQSSPVPGKGLTLR